MPSPLNTVLTFLPLHMRTGLSALSPIVANQVEEVRLRSGRPLMLTVGAKDLFVSVTGATSDPADAVICLERDVEQFLQSVTHASLYAREDQLRQGFLTLPGGHRVGVVGEAVLHNGELRTIKNIAGCNIRLARQVPGAADLLLPRLVLGGSLAHTLIASPPGCGKTTILRDLARQIANGVPQIGLPGLRVAIADERSEIAACYQGVPQLDVGVRSDVLDKCPKVDAVMLLLRAMGPQVVVTDEIGSERDAWALEEALHCGVILLASAHGSSLSDICRRAGVARLVQRGAFTRLVILSRRQGPGTIESVITLGESKVKRPC